MKIDRETKWLVLLNCLTPVGLLGWDAWHNQLGANPINFAIRTTGILSLLFLVLSLTVTPASRMTGYLWLGQFRRLLGLNAFFHAMLHFFLFYFYDRTANIRDTLTEIILRPYLMVGTFGLVLMIPLAVTSTNAMIRRMGPARWKLLHRLAYIAAAAGALHYYMLVKADVTQPLAFAGALGGLFLFRIGSQVRHSILQTQQHPNGVSTPPVPIRTSSVALRVAHLHDETPTVRTFRLVSPDGTRLPFDYLPGQYLNLILIIDGQTVRRSYTIASSPARMGYCELTIKREEQGLCSRYLHDQVRVGEVLQVIAPAGRFTFTGVESSGVVLIAGGVGITPLMSHIRYLTDLGWDGPIDLIAAMKTEKEIIFREELALLQRRHPNLHITFTLTREEGSGWTGKRGRITPELLLETVPDLLSRRVYICGPTEMANMTRAMLQRLRVPDPAIQVESFTSPARPASPGDRRTVGTTQTPVSQSDLNSEVGEPGEVTFSRSGKSTTASMHRTVLELAESLGIQLNYDCRAGICGQCKVRLISGNVVMEAEDALDAHDRANNNILACQARCQGGVVVDA